MILFYNKQTGNIVGTIDGRIHTDDHLKMWIGEKEENERIIVNWIPVRWYDVKGKEISKDAVDERGQSVLYAADFEPDHEQKELFQLFDNKKTEVLNYKVDLATKRLVKR